MSTESSANFQNLNFGTKPTGVNLEEIKVEIDPDIMIKDFGKAYLAECMRRNPLRTQASELTVEALQQYFTQIILLRVQYVNDECKVWRQIKQLNIPTWIQFTISQIGRVIDYDCGLKIMPVLSGEVDLDFLLDISSRLEVFKSDGITMHKDAFPRSIDGDRDVMSMTLINGYIQSMAATPHPISSYVAGFLGFKLREEQTFKILYRVRYDDINFIRSMILSERSLF